MHDLRYKALILHRDISPSNIRCDLRTGQEEPLFVLSGFDLAVKVASDGSPKGSTANHRTGTRPFLAIEHLEDLSKPVSTREDLLYHDYQSLFWVAVYCMIKYNSAAGTKTDEETRIKNSLRGWESGTFGDIADKKLALITSSSTFRKLPFAPAFHGKIYALVNRLRRVFRGVYSVRDTRIDEADMQGQDITDVTVAVTGKELDEMVTKEKILAALDTGTTLPSA